MVTNKQLEIFLAVYEGRSMTQAAQKLYMSQPAVSQAIREVEKEYGTVLFERYGNKLYATRSADIVYQYASRIFSLHKEMDAALRDNGGIRELRVGANISAGVEQIRRYIHSFNEIYPDIKVKVMVFNSKTLEAEIYNHNLDFALLEDLVRNTASDQLVTIPYYKDRIVLVGAPDYPLARKEHVHLADVASENILFRERGAGVRDKFEYILSLNNMHVDPIWECSSTEDIINAVRDRIGIAVLPYLLVKEYIDEGEVVEIPIEDVSLTRNLNIVYHKDKIITEPLKKFFDIILADK